MISDSLGDRMKEYENVWRTKLPRKHPVIIRVDGKSFHTFTKGMDKPFDERLITCMRRTAEYLLQNVQNCVLAYTQSDEISLLVDDRKTLETDAFFDNNLIKIVSVTSAMATYRFNIASTQLFNKEAMFDSRAFILPDNDVPNYFLWRMKDWERNSIQMLARSMYTPKELFKKRRADMFDMMHKKGVNWAKIKPHLRNGTLLYKKDREVVAVSKKFNHASLKKFIEDIQDGNK
jgi:tRNA(His) guanylyltransferase